MDFPDFNVMFKWSVSIPKNKYIENLKLKFFGDEEWRSGKLKIIAP